MYTYFYVIQKAYTNHANSYPRFTDSRTSYGNRDNNLVTENTIN